MSAEDVDASAPEGHVSNPEVSNNLRLQQEVKELKIKHKEELYWVRLELDTARSEKESMEDRVSDLQSEIESIHSSKPEKPLGGITPDYVLKLQHQLEKYERMIRVLSGQVEMIKSSSDAVVRSLKDEISDLVDEKCRAEMNLMNQMTKLEADLLRLKGQSPRLAPVSSTDECCDEDVEEIRARMIRLAIENTRLKKQLEAESFKLDRSEVDKLELNEKLTKLEGDWLVLRSSAGTLHTLGSSGLSKEEVESNLEDISRLWRQSDQTIEHVESLMTEVKLRVTDRGHGDNNVVDESYLSILELASLLNGENKVSLMHIEAKLRNNVNGIAMTSSTEYGNEHEEMKQTVEKLQIDTLAEVKRVEDSCRRDIESLTEQCARESSKLQSDVESRIKVLGHLKEEQSKLNSRIMELEQTSREEEKVEDAGGNMISQAVMDALEDEVLKAVTLIREKNTTIQSLRESHESLERQLSQGNSSKNSPRKQDCGSTSPPSALRPQEMKEEAKQEEKKSLTVNIQ